MKRTALILAAASFLIWQLSSGAAVSENLGDRILPSFHEKDQINNPKLSPAFNRLLQEMNTYGVRGAQDYGESRSLDMDNGLVWAIIEVDADPSVNLSEELQIQIRERIETLGGVWELVYRNRIQAWLPIEALEDIASWPNINLIREPFKPMPPSDPRKLMPQDAGSEGGQLRTTEAVEVVSQGVSVIDAGTWHASGLNGSGVRLAVIDGGFTGYTSLLGTELPSSVTTKIYGTSGDFAETEHGTACAEIIHDVAPGSALYLTQPRNDVELGNALDWCKVQGVKIISHSMGNFYGPFDGTGQINEIVNDAVDNGIIWVNSAGNYAQSHWSGNFSDTSGDIYHNFATDDEVNFFASSTVEKPVSIIMTWNDPWGYSSNDYDLLVVRQSPFSLIGQSITRQNGNDNPIEYYNFTPSVGVIYGFGIGKYSGAIKKLHVFVVPDSILQYQTASTSLSIPADNEMAITVGAVAWNTTSTIEPYSSQGPTVDGRIKPDLVAPDKVSTVSYGTSAFAGTSASCPHVAGACALVLQKNPSWTPAQVKSYLESNAVDLGAAGKDNIYGSGRLLLPDPGSGPVGENTYYIPYFVANAAFGTGMGLTNLGTGTAHVTISIYNPGGTLLKNETKTIAPRAQTAFLTGSDLAGNEGWMKITSDERVTGICLVARPRPLNLMFDITIIPKLCTSLIVPHVAQNSMWDTHVLLCNPNGSSASVTLTFVGGDGVVRGNRVVTIPKNGSTKVPVSTLATNPGNGRVEISADKGVAAFALYLDLKDGGYSYAGLSAVDPSDY